MRLNIPKLQSERDRDPKRGRTKWFHQKHGIVMANTRSEARARFKERGDLGNYPVIRAR